MISLTSGKSRVVLGEFRLIEPMASGGMASVWRAVHLKQGIPAAVKVLTPRFARQELADALRSEIRAMALLNHPQIVSVFDQGEVDGRSALLSKGRLSAGSPWVALEFVDGGTLANLYAGLTWPVLRRVLTQLLGALAHAHASGVIHRDIKLANVLVSAEAAAIKLTDFGIAYAMRRHEDGQDFRTVHAGTPRYMAPEQLMARVSEQGPWTDLYAVGALAWRLATGNLPFPDSFEEGARAKMRGRFYPFYPRFPVPEAFPGWCVRLMQPFPIDRFRTAADAANALDRMAPPLIVDPATGPTRRREEVVQPEPMSIIRCARQAAPLPLTWRTKTPWKRPVEFVGCGLRLFGLRGGSFVGRERLRDRLWKRLQAVHRTGAPQVVILRGPSGYGKTSLARWLSRRAEEVGGAIGLRTQWSDDARGGLSGLIARKFRCLGESGEAVEQAVETYRRDQAISGAEANRLRQLLDPVGVRQRGEEVGELGMAERFSLVTRVLRRMSNDRCVLVHLDDAHTSAEAFLYAQFVLDQEWPPRVLFVLTVQTEAQAERPEAKAAFDELARHHGVSIIHVGALPLDHQVDFVQGLLHLEPSLAARVARRTEGNPLFASQLLDDWVSRSLLELSVEGFRLRNPLDASLPTSLTEVWRDRVEALLEATHPHLRIPLELAAVLGTQVNIAEWLDVCARRGWPTPDCLVDALLARHLAVKEGDSWSFVHGMLREAILRSAANSGRLASHHRAVADTLALYDRVDSLRIGRHLLQAHAGVEAIDPLELGAEQAMINGDYDEALHLLRARAALLRSERIPRSDPRWGRGWIAQAEIYARLDRWHESAALAEEALSVGAEHDWSRVQIEALTLLVENRAVTDRDAALAFVDDAFQVAVQPGNEDTLASVSMLAAQVSRRSGQLKEALGYNERALGHMLTHGGVRRSRCEVELAITLVKLERFSDARLHLVRAQQLAKRQTQPFDLAACSYLLGNIARGEGDLEEAAKHYRDATDRFSVLGDANSWVTRAHLGIVHAERGQQKIARELLRSVLSSSSPLGDLLAHLGSLLCEADDVDVEGFEAHFTALSRYAEAGWSDPLAVRVVSLASKRAKEAGFVQRARRLRQFSRKQGQKLDVSVGRKAG